MDRLKGWTRRTLLVPTILYQLCQSLRAGERHFGALAGQNAIPDLGGAGAVEGNLLGEKLPQHDSECVDIHLLVVWFAGVQLRGHVGRRARSLLPIVNGCQTEVAQLHLPRAVDQEVRGLYIAMHYRRAAAVQVLEGAADVDAEGHRAPAVHLELPVVHHLEQRVRQVLHDNAEVWRSHACSDELHHVRMPQLSQSQHLLTEFLHDNICALRVEPTLHRHRRAFVHGSVHQ
mmetsp:Transcript_40189/g.67375  ORF Transcript_40189/g.67375 Transcript_40189/m.67375 type:complete len:231 (+) Transcript_40189:458-1150(+)